MRLEKDDAKIGLLVMLALAVFAGFLFHRSITAAFRKEARYDVALERASDLSVGTEVELQGLRVGQVEGIGLRREGVTYRFLATLGLRTDIVLWPGTRAVVVAKPLGGAYVDLQLPPVTMRGGAALEPGSRLEGAQGASPARVLDDMDRLLTNLDGAVGEVRSAFKAKGAGVVTSDPKIAKVLEDLDGTLGDFRKLAQESRGLVQQGGATLKTAEGGLQDLDHGLKQVNGLLDRHGADLDAAATHLAGTLRESEGLVKALRALVETSAPDAADTLKALDRNLRSTEELLEILKARPNRLVWGKPSQAEREAAEKRVEEARKAQARN